MLKRYATSALLGTIVTLAPPAQGQDVDLTGEPTRESSEPFTALTGVAEVAPGVIVTSDIREKRLVRLDFKTGEILDIGREGSGPGEWQLPLKVFAGKDNHVYVPDLMQAKMHVISPAGEIVKSVPLSAGSPGSGGMMSLTIPEGVDSKGRMYYNQMSFTQNQKPSETIPVVRRDFTDSNSPVDTVAWIPNPVAMSLSSPSGGSSQAFRVGGRTPYQARGDWAVLPNGTVAVVTAEPYQMAIHSKGNPPALGPELAYNPISVGAAERDAYRDRQKNLTRVAITSGGSGGGRSSSTRSMGDQEIPDESFPEVMPPFGSNSFQVAPNGSVWVLRNRAANDPTPTYDIFSVGGRVIGQAKLRPNSRVIGFGENSVYVRWQDPETDLVYLQQYGGES